MDWGIFLGLVAIAVAIFFGLREFGVGIKNELAAIKEKVMIIQETAQNVWDVIRRSPTFGNSNTVERNLPNLGKMRISAEPHLDSTVYFIQTEKLVLDDALIDKLSIDKLSKDTGLEEKEKQMFGKPQKLTNLRPTLLRLELSCTKPHECTEYISIFLKWLDSTYFAAMPKVEDFEEPIKT